MYFTTKSLLLEFTQGFSNRLVSCQQILALALRNCMENDEIILKDAQLTLVT